MNEKYILLSFATFIKENNVVSHEIKIKMHNYRVQYVLLKIYPLMIMKFTHDWLNVKVTSILHKKCVMFIEPVQPVDYVLHFILIH